MPHPAVFAIAIVGVLCGPDKALNPLGYVECALSVMAKIAKPLLEQQAKRQQDEQDRAYYSAVTGIQLSAGAPRAKLQMTAQERNHVSGSRRDHHAYRTARRCTASGSSGNRPDCKGAPSSASVANKLATGHRVAARAVASRFVERHAQ